MTKEPFWYWYRVRYGGPPGAWVICGPYVERPQADHARVRDKQDGQVGTVFSAESKEAAEKMKHHQ